MRYKTDVQQRHEVIDDLIEPTMQFWELEQYQEEFGDPQQNKANVVLKNVGKKKKRWNYGKMVLLFLLFLFVVLFLVVLVWFDI